MIYLELFWTFFKIGAFTFGGGYAMLPFIQEEVLAHQWMSMEELINFTAVSESTPGPFAVNISTYVGMTAGGVFGAFCATFGVVLPSFLLIVIISKCFARFRENRMVKGCLAGIKPAAIGLIGAAVLSIGREVLFPGGIAAEALASKEFYISLLICAAGIGMLVKKLHPIGIICVSAGAGILAGYFFRL